MKKLLISVGIYLAAACAHAAVWSPPSATVANLTPGTHSGVIGGIPVRTNDVNVVTYGADPTGATFSDVPVLDALTAAVSGDRVYFPPGTYKFQYSSPLAVKTGVTYYADPNPTTGEPDQVTFNLTNGATPAIGAGWSSGGASFVITGGLTQGSTSLTVSSSAGATVGSLLQIAVENDPAVPVVQVQDGQVTRGMMAMVTGVPDGTHISIFPPFPWTNGTQSGGAIQYTNPTSNAGFENITFNNFDGANQVMTVVAATYNCWIHNVKYLNPGAGSITVSYSSNFQYDGNWMDISPVVGAGAYGMLTSWVTNALIENNVFRKAQPNIEIKDSSCGMVIGYNYFEHAVGPFSNVLTNLNMNHAPHPSFQMVEGNIFSNIQTDGIFGSNGPDTIFRNLVRPGLGYPITLNRFSRQMVVVGNQVNGPFSVGNPNLGNSYYSGTVRPSDGDWWVSWDVAAQHPYRWVNTELTTRTSATAGVMTMPTGGGAWLQAQSDMAFSDKYFEVQGGNGFSAAKYVSRVGDVVTFDSANGTLPIAGSFFDVVPGSYGFQEQDQDTFQDWNTVWAGTTYARMNYYLLMPDDTNTITASAGIPTFELIGSDTLPASLYRSASPDFFVGTGLSWPPLDPLAPSGNEQAIPAGQRYYRIINGSGTTATVTNLNVGTIRLAP